MTNLSFLPAPWRKYVALEWMTFSEFMRDVPATSYESGKRMPREELPAYWRIILRWREERAKNV